MSRPRRRKPWYRRAWLVVTVIVLVLLAAAFAVFGPTGLALVQAKPVEGAVEIGSGVTVDPGEGWVAGPLVAGFPPSPIDDWTRLIEGEGRRLQSPDRLLEVEVEVVSGAPDPAELPGGEVRAETLASGAAVRHASSGNEFVAVVEGVGGEPISMRARTVGDSNLEAYRPVLSTLLESLSSGTSS